jgi:transposase InsO family protein
VSGRAVTIAPGAGVLFDGANARVVEFDGRTVVLQVGEGEYHSVAIAEFAARARGVEQAADSCDDPGLVLAGLDPGERARVAVRARHVREALTGYAAGHAGGAAPGEPRPPYAPGTALLSRYAAKAAELGVTARTVQNWVAAYRESGEAGLVNHRLSRARGSMVDARWDAAVRAEIAAGIEASTPTRAALLARAVARLEREHGAGVVPVPSRATAYRRLAQLAKGTNAVSGSAKGRRSIANRPAGVYGRLRATRPGEYLILDTQDLDVFAREAVTGRWVRAQLTVAQDLFDRQILGLKVTPVSTKAVDVAGVLFEAVTGRSPGRPGLGPLHGVPEHLVFTEGQTPAEVWCPPETLVIDHGKAFLSAHVIGVCARLGISIQPAQPYKATDKPTVERFFKTLRERLIERLPGYKGADVHSRGARVQEQAFFFLHELEDAIRDWIAADYHARKQDGLAVAQWATLALSPNEMHAIGIAKAGLLRLPATPELVFQFLAVRWRTLQHYGIEVDGLRYNGAALNRYRNQRSGYGGTHAGKWPIRVNPDDVRAVYFQDPHDGAWHALEWEHAWMLDTPFSADAAAYARTLAAREGRWPDPAAALREVLERWSSGAVADQRERRIAARMAAERTALPLIPTADDDQGCWPRAVGTVESELEDMAAADDTQEELALDVEAFYRDALEVLE